MRELDFQNRVIRHVCGSQDKIAESAESAPESQILFPDSETKQGNRVASAATAAAAAAAFAFFEVELQVHQGSAKGAGSVGTLSIYDKERREVRHESRQPGSSCCYKCSRNDRRD